MRTRPLAAAALAAATLAAATLAALPAAAKITSVRIDRNESFADGTSFGAAGPYVRLVGVARGELDPNDPANKGIVDLDKAPRNTAGKVEYETDIDILRPADPAKGNGTILFEVTNRGRKFLLPWIQDAVPVAAGAINDPKTAAHAGDGYAFRAGYTIVWNGW